MSSRGISFSHQAAEMSNDNNNGSTPSPEASARMQKLSEFAAHTAVGVLSPGAEHVPVHSESFKVQNEQYERILAELQEELVKVQVRELLLSFSCSSVRRSCGSRQRASRSSSSLRGATLPARAA
jgi:sulfatase maturation enzyme AslB (radical SAM superfamily)